MKKILSVAASLALVAAFSVSAFAGDFGTIDYDNVVDGNNSTSDIPVWGYVGEDGTLDPDPTDPSIPPVVTPDDDVVDVIVPVQILWAAFASDAGTVTSPNLYIENNHSTVDLKVTVKDFTPATGADNTAVDPDLTLNLTPAGTGFGGTALMTSGTPMTTNTTAESTIFAAGDKWDFTLSGTFAGSFATAYTPQYTLVLLFTLA